MKREAELLLGCLVREEAATKLRRFQGYTVSDWEALLAVAQKHGVGPYLYSELKSYYDQISMPGDKFEGLRGTYYAAVARNMRLYRQLFETLKALNKKGLQVVLLKGAHLAEAVYGNIALRSMSDVDLLVRVEDLKAVHEVLLLKGYAFTSEGALSNTKHLPPYTKKKGVCLEIHFHITDPPFADQIDIKEMWSRVVNTRFQGIDVYLLSPEDLYLHLCLHSALQHGFDLGLVSCLDIATLTERCRETVDWAQLWERGRQWGAERSVYLMAALAENMLGVTMPQIISGNGRSIAEKEKMVELAEEIIFNRGEKKGLSGVSTTRYLARLFGNQSWRVKWDYFKQRAFPSAENIYQGESRVEEKTKIDRLLHYLKRLKVLIKRHGKTVLSGLLGNRDTLAVMESQNEKNRLRDWLTG